MTDVDELDRIWRDGLWSAAETVVAREDPRPRVAVRVQHRRRVRRIRVAALVGVVGVLATFGVAVVNRPDRVAVVATEPPAPVVTEVVKIDDAPGGLLRIDAVGRGQEDPPAITLHTGLIRFEIRPGVPGHVLRLTGTPDFEADLSVPGLTLTRDVQLDPGNYVLYCAIPGHEAAGEQLEIHVVP